MSRAAAGHIADRVRQKPGSLLCFPSGDSPVGVFNYLIKYALEGNVNFSQCHFVGLDEWVGLGKNDEGSCTWSLYETFFNRLEIDPGHLHFFDAKAADLNASCQAMDNFIKDKGPLDIMLVGIGMNGHIGLNEPGTGFNLYSHHSPLAPITVSVGQKYFKQHTPLHEGITLGLKYLQEAKTPILLASGSKKAAIVRQALEGPVTDQLPGSIFQTLLSGMVFLDEGAASELTHLS